MRVLQFVTLFLALAVVCGCSHRRAQRNPVVTASLCDCATCRCDQERLIREGAIPADHFNNFEVSQGSNLIATPPPLATPLPLAAPPSDLSPEYTSEPAPVSPFTSGNPIEMDSEAPQTFSSPVVDKIETENFQLPASDSSNDLKLDLPGSNQITPLDQIPTETIPNGAFKPFNRDVFKAKSQIENTLPVDDQPSILIDKVTETYQADLSSIAPPTKQLPQLLEVQEPESNDFQMLDSIASNQLSLEEESLELVAPPEPVAKPIQPIRDQFTPTAEVSLPAPEKSIPVARTFAPVPRPIQQTETVVEGVLYEDPIVLYARQRRALLTASSVQTPGAVRPIEMQKPVEHQSMVQDSEFDPVYGLPLSNNVQFNSLPAVQQPTVAPTTNEAQHLHVHIHHDYDNAPTGQVRHSEQTGQQATNVQVVYRDDEGRIIMAPPTPTANIRSAEPYGDQRTYYVAPEQLLRLKATSPISRQRSEPSVATIQMRDTIIHGGTHLLATPDYQAKPVITEHGLPGIDYKRLREAFNNSPTANPLR